MSCPAHGHVLLEKGFADCPCDFAILKENFVYPYIISFQNVHFNVQKNLYNQTPACLRHLKKHKYYKIILFYEIF